MMSIPSLRAHPPTPSQEIMVAREGIPVGLANHGTDCFLNAVRQFVYNTPIKYIILHRLCSVSPLSNLMYEDFQRYQKQDRGRVMGGVSLLRGGLSKSMKEGHQSAHEALMGIFETIPNRWDNGTKNPLFNSIEHLKDGVTCKVSLKAPMALPIKDEAGHVMCCMQDVWDYYAMEQPEDGGATMAFKHQYRFENLPDHLLFSFIRNDSQSGAKIHNFIYSEPTFRLDGTHVKTGESADFHIQAFIVHEGEATYGHYYTYVYVQGEWFYCDDDRVFPIFSEREIENAMGRASIFYARRSGLSDQQVKDSFSPNRWANVPIEPPHMEALHDFDSPDFRVPGKTLLQDGMEGVEQIASSVLKEPIHTQEVDDYLKSIGKGKAGILRNAPQAEPQPKKVWKSVTILYAIGYYAFYLPLYYIAKAVYSIASFVLRLFFGSSNRTDDRIKSAKTELIEIQNRLRRFEAEEEFFTNIDLNVIKNRLHALQSVSTISVLKAFTSDLLDNLSNLYDALETEVYYDCLEEMTKEAEVYCV